MRALEMAGNYASVVVEVEVELALERWQINVIFGKSVLTALTSFHHGLPDALI